MSSPKVIRGSTDTLLEEEEIKDSEHKSLLGYADIERSDQEGNFFQRIRARYG